MDEDCILQGDVAVNGELTGRVDTHMSVKAQVPRLRGSVVFASLTFLVL